MKQLPAAPLHGHSLRIVSLCPHRNQPSTATMSADPSSSDACLPSPIKDFVFDLHDTARRSHLAPEQSALYAATYAALTRKYFESNPWPSAKAISSECGDDPLFLAVYTELTARHLHSLGRPSVTDRIAGWCVYSKLFDALLSEVEGGGTHPGARRQWAVPPPDLVLRRPARVRVPVPGFLPVPDQCVRGGREGPGGGEDSERGRDGDSAGAERESGGLVSAVQSLEGDAPFV